MIITGLRVPRDFELDGCNPNVPNGLFNGFNAPTGRDAPKALPACPRSGAKGSALSGPRDVGRLLFF